MDIYTLKYFNTVVKLKSISKAANACHISQSALSQKLYKLEKSLGITALERSNKGVNLTNEGEILYKYSEKITDLYSMLEDDLSNTNNEKNNLVIETNNLVASYILPQVINKASSKFNNFTYNVIYKYNANIYSDLINKQCDITIGINKLKDPEFTSIHLGHDELVCVCRCPYGTNIDKYPFLILEDEHNIENIISKFIKPDNILMRTNSIHTITTYLTTTKSFAILPRICIIDEIKQGLLTEIEIPNFKSKKYDLYLIYKNDINPSVKDKISYISKNIKSLLNKKNTI